MTNYYDVTVSENIPYGSKILNEPCKIFFTYPEGSHSHTYNAEVFSWFTPNQVRIATPHMNIEAAWEGANGGELAIKALQLQLPIIDFNKVG